LAKTFSSTNFYQLLGVKEDFLPQELDRAFRSLAKRYHPDAVVDPAEKELSLRKLQQLSEAYHVLKDANLKRYYDDWRMKRQIEEEREASSIKNKAFKLDSYIPQDQEAEFLVEGLALLDEGNVHESVTKLRMALHVAPQYHAARFFLGRALLRLGGDMASEGRRTMQEAIQLDPSLVIFMHEAQPQMTDFESIDRESLEFEEVTMDTDPEELKPRRWWQFRQ